ncbi:hypothetical protein GTC6_01350 [Gordonia terrae C-6]|uniref:Uncharacterized protein n=2 Tax=Gordonia terrae TaxID=2055 RepID=R7YGF8_9ACTN|nr:hypothetical protein GTC6_01350 [Gordonia terrae C-6]
MFATVDVVGQRLGLQRSVAWLSIVWIVPIVGATVWRLSTWWSERDPTADSPTGG